MSVGRHNTLTRSAAAGSHGPSIGNRAPYPHSPDEEEKFRRTRRKVYSNAVNEEDPERDRATQV